MQRVVGHLFTIVLGLVGWVVVIGLPVVGGSEPAVNTLTIALFVVVILAVRGLAFKPTTGTVLSLDSAYFVAATLCVGAVGAGRLVAVALTVDALVRLLYARRAHRVDPDGWFAELAYVLYFGGMSGGLLATCAWLLGADGFVGAIEPDAVGVS
nr:hypothetical protein [Deltaproteobacteria bacterium]